MLTNSGQGRFAIGHGLHVVTFGKHADQVLAHVSIVVGDQDRGTLPTP